MAASQNPNQNLTLIALLLMVVGFSANVYLVLPALESARTDQAEAQAKNDGLVQDIQTLRGAQAALQTTQADLQAKGVDFTGLEKIYPKTEDMPGLYVQMESIVQRAQNVQNITYQVGQPVLDLTAGAKVPITLTAVGSYSALKSFLASLQTAQRPLSLSLVSFSAYVQDTKSKKAQPPAGSFNLSVAGFVRSETLSSSYVASPK